MLREDFYLGVTFKADQIPKITVLSCFLGPGGEVNVKNLVLLAPVAANLRKHLRN